jgi:hypothetical protein
MSALPLPAGVSTSSSTAASPPKGRAATSAGLGADIPGSLPVHESTGSNSLLEFAAVDHYEMVPGGTAAARSAIHWRGGGRPRARCVLAWPGSLARCRWRWVSASTRSWQAENAGGFACARVTELEAGG